MNGEWITPKLRSWASIIEEQARVQAIQTASMDFVRPYMAIMPDIHYGRGCCVGAVIPTAGAIIPAAVGVDIGCGMIAWRLHYTAQDLWVNEDHHGRPLSELREMIQGAIPLSAGNYNTHVQRTAIPRVEELEQLIRADGCSVQKIAPNWHLQLGSLGSGNHFIEVCLDEEERVWLFLHSGSRGAGNKLARQHIDMAVKLCKGVRLPNRDLAYLTEGTDEFDNYIRDLSWAQEFARLNRDEMMERVAICFAKWMGIPSARPAEKVNCHHNYTEEEEVEGHGSHGEVVWLSRKGAIAAYDDSDGLIPGSMGAASYVVRGKGNAEALYTAPHGAGRRFSRGEAKRTFTTDELGKAMEGIEWDSSRAKMFLDESPAAYKPIGQIMRDSADLVEIRYTLRQVLNVKGD